MPTLRPRDPIGLRRVARPCTHTHTRPLLPRAQIFKRQDSDRFQVLGELKTAPYEGSGEEPTVAPPHT